MTAKLPPPGRSAHDSWPSIDVEALRAYRLTRVREQLRACDCAAAVLYDSINLRYATGTSYMPVFGMHVEGRHAFVAADGPVILFDKPHMLHLWPHAPVDAVRPAIAWRSVFAGPNVADNVKRWAREVYELLTQHGGGNRRLAIDNCQPAAAFALRELGVELIDAQEPMERARAIKSSEEIDCLKLAIAVAETGMARMQRALQPGISENQLWSLLAQTNIEHGGEWLECRLLSSGSRTNPWLQEASDRLIRPGELVAFDTDMIGPFGYCADLSRTFFCGPGSPSAEQRTLYGHAFEQLQHNVALMQPGTSLLEIASRAWPVPAKYRDQAYAFIAHGVGMCDEWPNAYQRERLLAQGEGETRLQAGMVMCVESYIGEKGGREGVKLEEQVLVTGSGYENLSTYPFEAALLDAGGAS